MLFGHLAVSALAHRYLKADLAPVMVAAVAPDAVDKLLCQGLHIFDSGRMWGHTLIGLALTTVLVRVIWGREVAWGWAVGYLGHLVADIGGDVPWLYPVVQYDLDASPGLWEILLRKLTDPTGMVLELALTVWAVVALRRAGCARLRWSRVEAG